jgi:hypothetical protein
MYNLIVGEIDSTKPKWYYSYWGDHLYDYRRINEVWLDENRMLVERRGGVGKYLALQFETEEEAMFFKLKYV